MNSVERVVEPIVNLFERIAGEYEDDASNVSSSEGIAVA